MVNTYTGGNLANVDIGAAYLTLDGVDVGLIGLSYSLINEITTKKTQFGQDTAPRGETVSEQRTAFEVILHELTLANITKYFAGLLTESGGSYYYGNNKGESLPTYEAKIYFLHQASHPLSGQVMTMHSVNIKPNGNIDFNPDGEDFDGLPVVIECLEDTSQTAGQEFFVIGPAVATAPTVSSTTPANSATSVAVDATVAITFAIAMSDGSIDEKSVLFTSTAKTATAFDEVVTFTASWNTAKTVLTLTPSVDLEASTEYQVILTTEAKSSYGVEMAAPYAFTFTTAA